MPSEMVGDTGTVEKTAPGDEKGLDPINLSMQLEKGCQLTEESKTDDDVQKTKLRRRITQRFNDTIARRMSLPVRILKKKPEIKVDEPEEFHIPSDGNIYGFDVEEMQLFLACFNLESRLLNHLREKKLDGRRFSHLTDTDLERIGLHNIVMCYFRDKSRRISGKLML